MEELTHKEENILAYILGYLEDNEYPPTRKEIGDRFGMTKQGADHYIISLKNKGRIKLITGSYRNIKVIQNDK